MTPDAAKVIVQTTGELPDFVAFLLIDLWEKAKEHCETSIVSGSIAEDEMDVILRKLEAL